MGKNILAGETGEVEPDPIRQEAKAGLRQLFAAFAGKHDVEARFERMEMDDVGGGVGKLRFAQFGRAPIGGLLLLRQLLPEDFTHQVLQSVFVGIGSRQPRGDLGAIDRLGHHIESLEENSEIETGEVKDLEQRLVGEQPFQIWSIAAARRNLYDIGGTVAWR